jgi:5-methylcytosine-specific restriction endonuclease McrA
MLKEIREKVWHKYNKRCSYCGKPLEYSKMQVDHIDAKYLGGANDIENYNPSCRGCNFYKNTFTIDGFRQQLVSLHERLEKIFIVRTAIRYGILKYKPFDGEFYFEKQNQKL